MPYIRYLPEHRSIEVEAGTTILEASMQAEIPHTHVCGGSARCSTCRVLIVSGLENCSDRTLAEKEISDRLHFNSNIRLACQTQVFGDIEARRLAIDAEDIECMRDELAGKVIPESIGQEKLVAILFADIRGFTAFSERLLPYDVIYVLNRYFRRMDKIITRYQGTINNYMGDGLMAIFGVDDSTRAAEFAVRAALEMSEAMEQFNLHLEALYDRRLQIGIGINYGSVAIGEVGAPHNKKLTAIGDAVNFASRIESANKQVGSALLISESTYQQIQQQAIIGRRVQVQIPGKSGEYPLYEVLAMAASSEPLVPEPRKQVSSIQMFVTAVEKFLRRCWRAWRRLFRLQ